jgi:tRNA threonylcarbamoyladenosine biosynthesis protein TsaE
MPTVISHSPAETEALGEEWARSAKIGWVIGLSGDLGAGKTQLVKGLARGLGITARVHSPTFTLVNVYSDGRVPLYHLDLYRLETREEIIAAGLEEYLTPKDGVTVIEWAERWFATGFEGLASGGKPENGTRNPQPAPLASSYRQVQIEATTESTRQITYEDFGG